MTKKGRGWKSRPVGLDIDCMCYYFVFALLVLVIGRSEGWIPWRAMTAKELATTNVDDESVAEASKEAQTLLSWSAREQQR